MQRINNIGSEAYQEVTYILDSGSTTTLTLRFLPTQGRWLLDVVDDNGFEIHGLYVCCHPNLLDKWHNVVKYGISVSTEDGIDPYRQEDFETGYAYFTMLDSDETEITTRYLDGLQQEV